MTGKTSPRARYRLGREETAREISSLEGELLRLSRLRTGAFFLMVVPLLLLETSSREWWPTLLAFAAVGTGAFFFLVQRHRGRSRTLERARLREQLFREGEARLDRNWSDLPPPPVEEASADHPSAGDLDLVGVGSLAHLIGRVTSVPGRTYLRRLLLDPFAPVPEHGLDLLPAGGAAEVSSGPRDDWLESLRERQEAVRALSSESDYLLDLELLGREVKGRSRLAETRSFLEWAESPGWLDERRGTVLLARCLGILIPLSLVGWFLGWTPGLIPALGALAALAQQRQLGREAHRQFTAAEGGEGELARWSALLEHLSRLPTGTARLDALTRSVQEPDPGAADALRDLRRITDTAGARRSALIHFPLVALFAWDVHLLHWLERWRRRHGTVVERWVRSLGEVEALAALSGLLHDHPDWTFPEIRDEKGTGIRGRAIRHPLLRPDRCVANDVELPPPGTLLVVTGSNMAGKTTLLRTMGVNQILALAGGPVAAAELDTRPLLPWTSMRIRDDLEEGVSFFLAELHRLRRVVEAARERPILYLLDEIFQGTNTAERRTAARIVLSQLIDTGSLGAVTTHDLTLADAEELRSRSVDVHLREEVVERGGRRTLDFDYLLRPGRATSRNALLLLELVGLTPGNPDSPGEESAPPGE